ncbi:MAG: TonB-dependent receptor [Bacteroidetes bacterium]|nr:TonB-dependent receptor [Bacteroidota bacterium]
MEKNRQLFALNGQSCIKFLLHMKLTVAFILIASLQLSAKTYSQQRITLKIQSTELKSALKQIERKSIYRFLYNNDVLSANQKVTIDANNSTVTEVLDNMFSNTSLTYRILDNNLVVITQKNFETQDIKVTGRVTNSNGEPIPGVSVKIKGSAVGTSTDAAGYFSISVPDGARLVFTSIGYEDVEVAVNKRTEINVTMSTSTKSIDAVVVIGYGTANKRDLTGSITKVLGKEIADKPNTNPVASLQGKVAGLSVVNNGTPGAAPDIRIRGTVSIGQVHPLYVVDGIFNDNIDYLNPNDIESIEVLKDPSSLAIFGVKGATGVIAITTKKAKAGQVVINFNTNYGTKKLVDKIKLVNNDQFKMLFAEENANNGVATPDLSALTANTDWIDAVTRTGKYSNSNLSVAGSTEKNKFNFGVGYIYDEGIIKHEKLDKLQLSFSDEFKISKAIKIGINLNSSRQNNPFNETSVLDAARKVVPGISAGTKTFRVANPYGGDSINANIYSGLLTSLQNSGVVNPILELDNLYNKFSSLEYRNVGSFFTEINFLKNFNFRSTLYADMSNVNARTYTPLYYAYDPSTNTPYLYSAKTQVSENDDSYKKFQQDYILTYKKSFRDHNLTATAGFTTYYFGHFGRYATAKPFTTGNALPIPDDKRFWYISSQFNDPAQTFATSGQNEYSTASVLGRILYNYKNKYYLNASLRDDASSQIPTKNQHQKFWALGAAWDLTKENFMADIPQIDFLKLKASIGVLGNQSASFLDGTPINYPFYPQLNTGVVAVFGTNTYAAASQRWDPNPDLKWETVHAQEVGVELNAFKNKLHFEANYFSKTTKDLMTFVDRSSQGLNNILENGGSLKNWGEEFSATWNQNLQKDLSISLGGNITFLKNKVLSLSPDIPGGFLSRGSYNNNSAESRTIPGYPIGSFYGYVVEGLYQSYADVLKSPVASAVGAYGPGDFKFKDVNGDGKITPDDRTIIGNPTPKFTYGTSVNVNYKSWSLGLDMGGVYGNQVFRAWGSLESPFQRVNYSADKLDRWHGAGTSNWVPIISQGHRFNYNGSTYNIEDGSYFRLRNVQLAYTFSQHLISRAKMKSARAFVNIQNLKTWKNNLGYTAEFGGDATRFGYDEAGGAIPVVSTIGLNISF